MELESAANHRSRRSHHHKDGIKARFAHQRRVAAHSHHHACGGGGRHGEPHQTAQVHQSPRARHRHDHEHRAQVHPHSFRGNAEDHRGAEGEGSQLRHGGAHRACESAAARAHTSFCQFVQTRRRTCLRHGREVLQRHGEPHQDESDEAGCGGLRRFLLIAAYFVAVLLDRYYFGGAMDTLIFGGLV